jgi:lipopolysaccharide export system protein LptA
MTWKQIAPAIALMAVLAVVLIWVGLRTAPPAQPTQPGQTVQAPRKAALKDLIPGAGRVRMSGSTMSETDDQGNEVWHAAFQGEAEVDAKAGRATAKNVVVTVRFAEKQDMILEAPSFDANLTTMNMSFPRGTSGRAADGSARFTADTFEYRARAGKIVGRGHVSFDRLGFLMTGDSLVIDTKTKDIMVTGSPTHFAHAPRPPQSASR